VWNTSVLIITWDEHGGFFDHVAPPAAPPPGDPSPKDNNKYGFAFDRFGPRVPALVISPHIPRNVIDHRVYDHASIPATIERAFGLAPLTRRDALANAPTSLLTLPAPRNDAPLTIGPAMAPITRSDLATVTPLHPSAPVEQDHVAAFLAAAATQDLALSGPGQRAAIAARVKAIRTHAEAHVYMAEVERRAAAARRTHRAEPAPSHPVRPVAAPHSGTPE
jgi:phospholipase C